MVLSPMIWLCFMLLITFCALVNCGALMSLNVKHGHYPTVKATLPANSMERIPRRGIAVAGGVCVGKILVATGAVDFLCLWSGHRGGVRADVPPDEQGTDPAGMDVAGVLGGVTGVLSNARLVGGVAGGFLSAWLAALVGHDCRDGLSWVTTGAMACGCALGMEFRSHHAVLHHTAGIAAGGIGFSPQSHGIHAGMVGDAGLTLGFGHGGGFGRHHHPLDSQAAKKSATAPAWHENRPMGYGATGTGGGRFLCGTHLGAAAQPV